jgi:hypothetical protein
VRSVVDDDVIAVVIIVTVGILLLLSSNVSSHHPSFLVETTGRTLGNLPQLTCLGSAGQS